MRTNQYLFYVIAWVAGELGLEGEAVSLGNSFHRDGGWAAANYPQHYPGVIVTPADIEKIQAAGKTRYVNVRIQKSGQWVLLGSGEEALRKVGLP